MNAISVVLPGVMVIVLGVQTVRAEQAGAQATAETRVHVAVGVNSPLSWPDNVSFGGSLYVGIGEHHAIRANVARYEYRHNPVGDVIAGLANSDGDEASYSGSTSDRGLGWVYYPRSPWSGLSLELGVLRRERDHHLEDDDATPETIATRTTTYAGRAMIGWSWLMYDHVFLAVAAGMSLGHESGTETTERYVGAMPVQTKVSRTVAEGEGLLRLGVAFDL
jgi:hypothetical protein